MIRLGEGAPALQKIRAPTRELSMPRPPVDPLRQLYGVTDNTPIDSRVDQPAKDNVVVADAAQTETLGRAVDSQRAVA